MTRINFNNLEIKLNARVVESSERRNDISADTNHHFNEGKDTIRWSTPIDCCSRYTPLQTHEKKRQDTEAPWSNVGCDENASQLE